MAKKLFFLFLMLSLSVKSQDFTKVDALVSRYPRFSNPQDLAAKINQDFSSDANKSRAIFTWLAKNIRYDLEEFYNPKQKSFGFRYSSEAEKQQKLQAIKNGIVQKAFLTKQGVCEAYAQSFQKVADLMGLEAAVIKGSVRNSANEIGTIATNSNHAWNAVKLNNKWMYLDATWAAGYEMNGKWQRDFNDYFYDMPKEKIFQTHYPEEKIWELRIGRISKINFYNQPIYSHSFLNSTINLISPKQGKISIPTGKNIELQLENLPENTAVFYVFKENPYIQKPSMVREGNTAIISIPNPQKSTALYIFINEELALQYKVIVE